MRNGIETTAVDDLCAGGSGHGVVLLQAQLDKLRFAGQINVVDSTFCAGGDQSLAVVDIRPHRGDHHLRGFGHARQRPGIEAVRLDQTQRFATRVGLRKTPLDLRQLAHAAARQCPPVNPVAPNRMRSNCRLATPFSQPVQPSHPATATGIRTHYRPLARAVQVASSSPGGALKFGHRHDRPTRMRLKNSNEPRTRSSSSPRLLGSRRSASSRTPYRLTRVLSGCDSQQVTLSS